MSFGEIRSLLQQPPSRDGWETLCAALDDLPAHTIDDMIVPYVLGQTRQWPIELRRTPEVWVRRALDGEPVPFWGIASNLDLSCQYLKPEQTLRFLRDAALSHIRALDLSSNRIGDKGAQLIATSALPLQVLRLGFNEITSKGVQALVVSRALAELEVLDLSHNELDASALQSMAFAPWLPNLRELNLGATAPPLPPQRYTSAGLQPCTSAKLQKYVVALAQLITSGQLGRLETLTLDHIPLADQAHYTIFGARLPITALDLRDTALDDVGLSRLVRAPWLHQLQRLDLSRNPLTSVDALIEAAPAHLQKLYLGGCELDRRAISALLDAPWLEQLRVLELGRNPGSARVADDHHRLSRVMRLTY